MSSSDPELYSAWTKVSKKRGRPTQEDNIREANIARKTAICFIPPQHPTVTQLSPNEDSSEHHQKSKIETTPKPPPIFVSNVTTISPLIQLLEQIAKLQY
jgi:hypothetical protein